MSLAVKALAEDGVLGRGDDGWTLSHGSRAALARGAQAWAWHNSPVSAVLIELVQDVSWLHSAGPGADPERRGDQRRAGEFA